MLLTRIGAIFVAACMVLIAASVGAVSFLTFGLEIWQAATAALATLVVLAIINMLTSRERDRGAFGDHIADISRGQADIARQVAAMDRRMVVMEGKIEGALSKTRAVTDPLALELGELGTLVKQLADSVAAQDASRPRLLGLDMPIPVSTQAPAATSLAEFASDFAPEPKPSGSAGFATTPRHEITSTIRAAVDANRVDLYLQPIVTLPQRKVRYYEALSRLRLGEGDILPAADFIPHADAAGLMPRIDNLIVFRCVQVVRRLQLKNREVGLFCNISGATLADTAVFQQLLEFLEANRAIAPSLVLEFTQSAWRAMGPIEQEALAALAERGYRFSLDNMTDLHFEPRELAQRHVKFVKVPGTLLLSRIGTAMSSDIHPADLSDLLARSGIDLIAEKIESESTVVDLLDYDVRFGQGFLFSQPRPVRADALQGSVDTNGAGRASPKTAPETEKPPVRTLRSTLAQLAPTVTDRV